jgi:hypothetical protein
MKESGRSGGRAGGQGDVPLPATQDCICLYSDLSVCKSVDLDVAVIVSWDSNLQGEKAFRTAKDILMAQSYESPSLDAQQKLLLAFVDCPSHDFFPNKLTQAKTFDEIKTLAKSGWKSETTHKKMWKLKFTSNMLSLLLVL